MAAFTFLARRFVAGETCESAVVAGKQLQARGIRATFDLLGEAVKDERTARKSAEGNKELLRCIPSEVERNISVKLTNLGLAFSRELCEELLSDVVSTANDVSGFVRIDMEGSAYTDVTLRIFRKMRGHFTNVGVVLQAYLHRTQRDVEEAIANGDRVRLCKGAYDEPSVIAYQDMDDIRRSFRGAARLLLEKGNHPAIATHDEGLIQDVVTFTRDAQIPPSGYEFQMLYGLRRRRWDSLVADGHNVRVYVPYGTHWLPYFYRRLHERRENVFFALRHLVRG